MPPLSPRPSLRFAWEPLTALLDDGLAEIVERHWHEVGVHPDDVPLDVDWDGYQQDEDAGLLKVMAARRGDRLIGYASFYVRYHRHYRSTLHAMNDAIWVEPSERGVGIRLIMAAERALVKLAAPGVVRILYRAKLHLFPERGTVGKVFERLGYSAFEVEYDKIAK